MTKKSLTLLLVLMLSIMLVFAFASCGGSENPSDISTDTGTQGTTPSPDDDNGTDDGNGGNGGASDGEAHTHSYGDWKVVAEPTCTEDGLKKQECSCGDYKTEAIEAGHTEVILQSIEPTCTTSGLTEGKKCSVCQTVIVEQTKIPMTGHNAVNGICIVCDLKLESIGLSYTLDETTNTYTVMGIGICEDTEIVIPDTYKGLPVTSIGRRAFYNCTSITSIKIPNSITVIGDSAFTNCSSLKYNEYDNGYYIGNDTNQYLVLLRAKNAFITSCTVNKETRFIHSDAFTKCNKLVEIYNLSSLAIAAGSSSYGYIGKYAKVIHASLEEESILETVDDYIFMTWEDKYYLIGYVGEDKELFLPQSYNNSNYDIYDFALYQCIDITKVTIPNIVISIGNSAFNGCTSLTSIEIPNSVTLIGNNTFANCESLISVKIGNSLAKLANNSFSNCNLLQSISVDESNMSYKSIAGNLYTKDSKTLILYAIGKTNTSFVIPSEVTTIGEGAFSGCTTLKSVTISENVTSIGNHAFANCVSITEIKFNAKEVADLGSYNGVFANVGQNADGIKLIIGKNVTKIPSNIFCPSTSSWLKPIKITSVEFENESVCKIIGEYAFSRCAELTSITIPKSVITISKYAFSACTKLSNVTFEKLDGWQLTRESTTIYITDLTNSQTNASLLKSQYSSYCWSLHTHSYGEWVTVTKPTCSKEGLKKQTCSCGAYVTEEIETIAHTETTIAGKEATCTETGLTDGKKCTVCQTVTVKQEVIPAKGHTETTIAGKEATCIKTGLTDGKKCTVCQAVTVKQEVIPAKGHTETVIKGKEATCTEAGITDGKTCTVCQTVTVKQEVIPAKGHTETTIPGKEATCTETGLTDGKQCTVCQAVIVKQTTIPQKDHSIVDNVCENCKQVILKFTLSECGTYYIVSGTNDKTIVNITVSNTYQSLPVTSIGNNAFINCTSLKSITIGDSVTSMGEDAFYGCDSLKEVHISDIASWCNIAFVDYYSNPLSHAKNLYINNELITNLIIPNTVNEIKDYAFLGGSFTSVSIPNSVTSIGYEAFRYCTSLTSINIPNSVTSIGDYAFFNCTKLKYNEYDNGYYLGNEINPYLVLVKANDNSITSCDIHEDTKFIHSEAFNRCTSLTSITIPESVTSIGERAFSICTSLTEINFNATAMDDLTSQNYVFSYAENDTNGIKVTIGKNVTKIPAYLFCPYNDSYSPKITSVEFEDGSVCESIGSCAFSGRTLLTSITIPNSITSIEYGAFSKCTSLTSITIPNSVKSIGNSAFNNCTSLTEINFNATAMEVIKSSNGVFYNAGKDTEGIKVTIGKNVTKIPACLFYSSKITSVEFEEESVCESIGGSAFSGCNSLTSVIIPDSVTSIGEYAFLGCKSLTSVTIPDSVTSIGDCAFKSCTSLTSITIPDSVTSIGGSAFYNCTNLTEIKFNATAMDDLSENNNVFFNAGKNGSGIKVTIGKNVTKIPSYLFDTYYSSDSPNITILEFEEGSICESIGNSSFYGCGSLTSITIPSSVTSIGNDAFQWCSSLTSVNYLGTIEQWCNILFGNSTSNPLCYAKNLYINNELVTNLTIPNTVTKINDYAFYNCTSLTSVTIPNSVTSIGDAAFYNCTSLTSITIPNSVTSIGNYAFIGSNITIYCNVASQPSGWSSSWYSDCTVWFDAKDGGITEDGFEWYQSNSMGTIVIAAYAGDKAQAVIPDNINGIAVATIGNDAFKNSTSLTSVTIPNSVLSIGDYAFYSCDSLTSVTIGSGVTSIGSDAFRDCTSLVEINFNATAMKDLSNLNTVFSNTGNETNGIKVTIGKNVTKIPAYLFCPYSSSYSYSPKITSVVFEEESVCESIGGAAFSGCNSLTSITIPDSVTSIGEYAFLGCKSLTSVTIGNGVALIGNHAFYGCALLTNVNFEEGSECEIIGESVFYDCIALTSITIPDSVTSIGSDAFRNCTSLTSVTIGNGVKAIGGHAFDGCTSLTSITIGGNVTSIGGHAFNNCTNLAEIDFNATAMDDLTSQNYVFTNAGNDTNGIKVAIGKNVTKIPAYLFCPDNSYSDNSSSYSPKITSVEFEEESLCESIGGSAFGGCNSLTSITIPDSVTSIGEYAFDGCTSLTSITIPDSVITIENAAFSDCTALTSVTIGEGVTSIGGSAFYNCTSLTEIYFNATAMDDLNSYDSVFYNAGKDGNGIKVIIGNNVTKIPAYLFSNSPKITSVTIGDNVTSIGMRAFNGCDTLTSITIGKSVTTIFDYAFSGCHRLVEVYNLSSLDIKVNNVGAGGVGQYAKIIHTSLEEESILHTTQDGYVFIVVSDNEIYLVDYIGEETELTLPESYNGNNYEINQYAFYKRNDITKVTISNSVTSIGAAAFYNCTLLTNITIPDSVTSIGYDAFSECTSLTSITIPNSVTSIGSAAFVRCTSLTSITIPNSITSIGTSAFSYCDSLTSIIIPDSVTSIGRYAFSNCTSLTSITIPNSVKSIGDGAFDGCSSLKYNEYDNAYYLGNETNPYLVLVKAKDNSITSCDIHEETKFIHSYAFYNCTSLTSITIGNSVTSIGEYAFEDCASLTEIKFNATSMDDLNSNDYVFKSAGQNGEGIKVTIGNNVTKIPAYLFCPYSDSSYSPKIISITFENTSGWYVTKTHGATSGTNVDVTDTSTNATNLTDTYSNYYWYRKAE